MVWGGGRGGDRNGCLVVVMVVVGEGVGDRECPYAMSGP